MAKHQVMFCMSSYLLLAMAFLLSTTTSATTDTLDVIALNYLYGRLDMPIQLTGWRVLSGDPCGDRWRGVTCSGNSVESIDISGYGIRATLNFPPPFGFNSLKYLDASFNHLHGKIPFNLPTRITHLDLSNNHLSGNIPLALGQLTYLSYLNLSHNHLSGPLGEALAGLNHLKQMDLTQNNFTDDPGTIPNLCAEKNMSLLGSCAPSPAPPPPRPPIPTPLPPPTPTNGPTSEEEKAHHKKTVPIVIACIIGLVVLAAFSVVIFKVCIRPQVTKSKSKKVPGITQEQLPATISPLVTSSLTSSIHDGSIPDLGVETVEPTGSRSSTKKYEFQMMPIPYSLDDLLLATRNFNGKNLIGQSLISSIYLGVFANGQILTVKKMELEDILEEELFLKVIWDMSHLKHPSIAGLVGYCLEQGQCLLVYEYAGCLSLENVLNHSRNAYSQDAYTIFSWNDRLSIALGIARALEYLHCKCSPPVAHGSIMPAKILIDNELMPYILDCGLLHYSKSRDCQLPTDCTEYTAPEFGMLHVDEKMSDIYGFGVMLLELLTGRKPFDSVKEQQSLVKWAFSTLLMSDIHSLQKMVDPAIKGRISSRDLSHFADVIARCIQPEPQFRPPINMIAEELELFVQRQAVDEISLKWWVNGNFTDEGTGK